MNSDQHNFLDHILKKHASFKQQRFLEDAKPMLRTAENNILIILVLIPYINFLHNIVK